MNTKSKTLAAYIVKLHESNRFDYATTIDGNYQNMGATIIDGILQAGISYTTTVKPRVENFLSNYPNIRTTSQFKKLYEDETLSLPQLINWKESAKTQRIKNVTNFLIENGIETEPQFKIWLENETNIKNFKKLSGIKDKTVDYFKILTGHKTNAIDRHLLNFLALANIKVDSYKEAQTVISSAASILKIDEAYLDHSIWRYMSQAARTNTPLCRA
jgi:hypothetical protein